MLRRLLGLFARGGPAALDPGRSDLVIVAQAGDPLEAAGTVLSRAAIAEPRWREPELAVLRHHMVFPAHDDRSGEAASIAALDGYTLARTGVPSIEVADGEKHVVLQRVQVLSVLGCAQEASRMASLASRLGGDCRGWDALQPREPA
ncbi:hypothetical protein ONR57_18950 [Hoyosella sp. YIM 151337]|uniref:hypothetical protein n=1 Tax=Hoyosella sp. YIM 151337 TaxID=2992742 RepID=UPI002235B547|nr:hypothetical protein [Hoyosella sp. YIM 151337]MCW4355385.1 hypothetical protein [Hoyosella sp. YIM 151337]